MAGENDEFIEGLGFFCKVEDQQHFRRICRSIEGKGYFTDRVLRDRVTVRLSDLALIVSPERKLAFAVHVRPISTGTTGNRGFKGGNPVELDITEDELEGVLSDESFLVVQEAMAKPSLRPNSEVWGEVWEAIKSLRPELREELIRLERLRLDDVFEFDADGRGAQRFFEKDAVAVSLQSAGLPFGSVFAELTHGLQSGKSLLESLCGNATEDLVIDHDVKSLPGFIKESDLLHACVLAKGNNRITIYNVNRRRAEAALGVDLIYHNTEYCSFVFVQYKMLDNEGRKAIERWRFRPDSQFEKDVDRMRNARSYLHGRTEGVAPDSYRLSVDPFFFKFCRRQHLKVNAGLLTRGNYLSLSHLDLMLDKMATEGKAVVIGPETMKRWLTRSSFAALVSGGWIGTSGVSDEKLSMFVQSALEARRSVIVAVGEVASESGDVEE